MTTWAGHPPHKLRKFHCHVRFFSQCWLLILSLKEGLVECATVQTGAFCQFPFRWIYYYGSSKSTGKETGKTHLYAGYTS